MKPQFTPQSWRQMNGSFWAESKNIKIADINE